MVEKSIDQYSILHPVGCFLEPLTGMFSWPEDTGTPCGAWRVGGGVNNGKRIPKADAQQPQFNNELLCIVKHAVRPVAIN
jgi:hypothetical protein